MIRMFWPQGYKMQLKKSLRDFWEEKSPVKWVDYAGLQATEKSLIKKVLPQPQDTQSLLGAAYKKQDQYSHVYVIYIYIGCIIFTIFKVTVHDISYCSMLNSQW